MPSVLSVAQIRYSSEYSGAARRGALVFEHADQREHRAARPRALTFHVNAQLVEAWLQVDLGENFRRLAEALQNLLRRQGRRAFVPGGGVGLDLVRGVLGLAQCNLRRRLRRIVAKTLLQIRRQIGQRDGGDAVAMPEDDRHGRHLQNAHVIINIRAHMDFGDDWRIWRGNILHCARAAARRACGSRTRRRGRGRRRLAKSRRAQAQPNRQSHSQFIQEGFHGIFSSYQKFPIRRTFMLDW